jgi:DNA-binding CsgD family transcriptional regulator
MRTALRESQARYQVTSDWDILTPRERDVLRLVALGHTSVEIARILSLSSRTIETHRARIHASCAWPLAQTSSGTRYSAACCRPEGRLHPTATQSRLMIRWIGGKTHTRT